MLIRVDPSSEVPLFEQLASGIRSSVVAARLVTGERLPAARELAASLDINVHTVLRAYQVLRDEELIELRRGRGAIVSARSRDYSALNESIASVVAEAKKLDLNQAALTALIREEFE